MDSLLNVSLVLNSNLKNKQDVGYIRKAIENKMQTMTLPLNKSLEWLQCKFCMLLCRYKGRVGLKRGNNDSQNYGIDTKEELNKVFMIESIYEVMIEIYKFTYEIKKALFFFVLFLFFHSIMKKA